MTVASGAPSSFPSSTLSRIMQAATWICAGTVSLPDAFQVERFPVRLHLQVDEILKGDLLISPCEVYLPRQGSFQDVAQAAREADGFQGLLFLRRRSLPPNDGILELPWGIDPDLSQEAASFGALRGHLERLLALRRVQVEIALNALTGDDPRLREEGAFDLEHTDGLAVLLRAGDLRQLLTTLGGVALSNQARLALLRTLMRVPKAATQLTGALRSLIGLDFVTEEFRALASEFLSRPVAG